MPDLLPGIYLHIPFCRSKCGYCAFISYPIHSHDPGKYLAALHHEIEYYASQSWAGKQTFGSIFIGGGTPTILAASEISGLLKSLRHKFRISPDAEISVETNPNAISREKLAELRAAGVNRLSIGIQSFCDPILKGINRTHTAAEGMEAVKMARAAGFSNLNLDLIYGLPDQTMDDWSATLQQAFELAPEHLAVYQLGLDSGSAFAARAERGELSLPDEESEADMAEKTIELLTETNFERYEISNYARRGFRCRHNLIYWRNGFYIGMGAGAVSCLSGLRIRNVLEPKTYQQLLTDNIPPYLEAETLDRQARFRETVIMGLRMLEGIDLDDLKNRFSIDPEKYYGDLLTSLAQQELVEITAGRMKLTEKALPVANQILSKLV